MVAVDFRDSMDTRECETGSPSLLTKTIAISLAVGALYLRWSECRSHLKTMFTTVTSSPASFDSAITRDSTSRSMRYVSDNRLCCLKKRSI
ncbi:hypothetical protein AVEN_20405-1 [Araneus ventricosus]|uniref:Uncharacterized protein n=1 Tax=Araneus ventricosus TaxID=182803 RepID=A0A4Y2AJT2_ARAVE|nr:hypothetical protein AVEN_99501-1 [Araneus ventricosus]GBL80141.1 hypothetical protein AVEN_20405-1 [Araneus ventricosus]